MTRLKTLTSTFLAGLCALATIGCTSINQPQKAPDAPLIARADLFARPNTYFHRMNASGKKLAYLDVSTPRQVNIQDVGCSPCSNSPVELPDGGRPFVLFWTKDENRMVIVYSSPTKRRLDIATYDLASKQFQSLFPEENVASVYSDASTNSFYATPLSIYKVSNKGQDEQYFKIDFTNGQRVPVLFKNHILHVETIAGGDIGLNLTDKPDAHEWLYIGATGKIISLATFKQEDRKLFSGFLTSYLDAQNVPHAQFFDSSTTDTLAVSDVDLVTGKKSIIAQDKADIRNVLVQPQKPIDAYIRNYLKPEWVPVSPELSQDLAFLSQMQNPVSGIWSRTKDDTKWLITQLNSSGQETVSVFDRHSHQLTPITVPGSKQPDINPVLQIRAEVVPARDNTPLVSYLTTPAGKTCSHNDCPLVVYLHGGPRLRDEFPRTPVVTWLADRGYAVLTVNYRGSSGFGKSYEALNIGQWGLAMQDDVLDAVAWAIANKVADPAKIAVMGASHGGFLALNSVSSAPNRFACAVASGATGNLASFVEKVTTSQPNLADDLYQSVGDVRKPEVKAALLARSPISKVAAVKTPVLITHGGKDQQSPISDIEEYVAALSAAGGKVGFIVFPEEWHGFGNQDTKLMYYGIVERFLASCLGGRAEPVTLNGDKSKIDIRQSTSLSPFQISTN